MNATPPKRKRPRLFYHNHGRTGAVAVETALTLPILFIVVFASFDFARAHTLLHTADNAAYEGARQGIMPGATSTDVKNKAIDVLHRVGTTGAEVNVTPAEIAPDTEQVTVEIEIPMNTNGFVTGMFFRDKLIHGRCTLRRESFSQTYVP